MQVVPIVWMWNFVNSMERKNPMGASKNLIIKQFTSFYFLVRRQGQITDCGYYL